MTKIIPITAFACSICNKQHDTPAEAIACHDSHPPPNHIEMSHICAECQEECSGGNCKLFGKSLSTPTPNKELQ
jgi:hypothetical protein